MTSMTDTFRKEYNSLYKLHSYEKQIKLKAEELEIMLRNIPGREASLALTNLEQSIMWAIKGLYTFKPADWRNPNGRSIGAGKLI